MPNEIKYIEVCANCGSDDVEVKAWVNKKTGEIDECCFDDDDTYCNVCESHTGIIFKEVEESKI